MRRRSRIEKDVSEPENKSVKVKKVKSHVKRVGTHSALVIILWVLLLGSVAFGIYKNFTAIDTYTVHEVETVRYEAKDTTGIATFTEDFVRCYYAWNQGVDEAVRAENLRAYMTEDLVAVNTSAVTYASVSSEVTGVHIWSVEMLDEHRYDVIFEVSQHLKWMETEKEMQTTTQETTDEDGETITQEIQVEVDVDKEKSRDTKSIYKTCVYRDDLNKMVIIRNPTVQPNNEKSDYTSELVQTDDSIPLDQINEMTTFLNTFFGLYPSITDIELGYYVKNGVMEPISKEYEFVQLINPVFTKAEGEQIKVSLYVEYVDSQTTAKQISQYTLTLAKDGNWFIVGCD